MSEQRLKNINLGIYKVWWKTGGSSVASIYMDQAGVKYIAPSNWSSPGKLSKQIHSIKKLTKKH